MTLELLASRVDAMEKSKSAWEGLCREMLATITLEANKEYFSVLDDTWHKSVDVWVNRFHSIEAAEQSFAPDVAMCEDCGKSPAMEGCSVCAECGL